MPRDYEMALIVDTQLSDEGVDEAVKRYETLLGEQGASIFNVDRWGARKLAYEIRKRPQGDYTFIAFQAEPDKIEVVDRACRLDEAVLRHLIIQAERPLQEAPAAAEEVQEESSEDALEAADEVESDDLEEEEESA